MRFAAPSFTAGAGRVVFGRTAATDDGPTVSVTALKGKAAERHRRMVQAAADLCPELPAPGEHVHCLMTGFFDLCQVITDVARRAKPAAVRIATLCWNKRNAVELAGLMEGRAAASSPLALTLIASDFFHQHNKELVATTRELLEPFGARIVSARSHAKVTTFDLGAGDGLVFEGSANLRTNRNTEQLTIIRDRQSHDWHAAWMDRLAGV